MCNTFPTVFISYICVARANSPILGLVGVKGVWAAFWMAKEWITNVIHVTIFKHKLHCYADSKIRSLASSHMTILIWKQQRTLCSHRPGKSTLKLVQPMTRGVPSTSWSLSSIQWPGREIPSATHKVLLPAGRLDYCVDDLDFLSGSLCTEKGVAHLEKSWSDHGQTNQTGASHVW